MDVIFPLYKSWGIAGVKAGFVQVGSQGWNKWNEEVVRKAAEYQLLVNIHDAYRPTGFSRTYPNLLTQEGYMVMNKTRMQIIARLYLLCVLQSDGRFHSWIF